MAIVFSHRQFIEPGGFTLFGWYAYICKHCGRDVCGVVNMKSPFGLGETSAK